MREHHSLYMMTSNCCIFLKQHQQQLRLDFPKSKLNYRFHATFTFMPITKQKCSKADFLTDLSCHFFKIFYHCSNYNCYNLRYYKATTIKRTSGRAGKQTPAPFHSSSSLKKLKTCDCVREAEGTSQRVSKGWSSLPSCFYSHVKRSDWSLSFGNADSETGPFYHGNKTYIHSN